MTEQIVLEEVIEPNFEPNEAGVPSFLFVQRVGTVVCVSCHRQG
jgi:hypothetical protein